MKYLVAILAIMVSFSLQAQEEEPSYYIHSIYFGGGNYYIDGQQVEDLNEWLDGIPEIQNHEISIHSHTDDIGGKEYNDWLSQMRSESALEKLLGHGIPPEIISIEDFGELNPVYDNSTWEGKLKNRRVDIIIKPVSI